MVLQPIRKLPSFFGLRWRRNKPTFQRGGILPTIEPQQPAGLGSSRTSSGNNKQCLKDRLALPDQAETACIKAKIASTFAKLDAAILSGVEPSDETVVSINLHFLDLCRTANNLCRVLKRTFFVERDLIDTHTNGKNQSTDSSDLEIIVECPRGPSRSATPFNSSLLNVSSSIYLDEYPDNDSTYFSCLTSCDSETFPTIPTPIKVCIAPLRIPVRRPPPRSATNTAHYCTPEPFEQEIEALNMQIDESSQLGWSQMTCTIIRPSTVPLLDV